MREQEEKRACKAKETMSELHLWISLRIGYLKEVDGVPQGSLL